MTPEAVELTKYVVAVVVPAIVGLLTLGLSNRHNRSQARAEHAHQKVLADTASQEARIERRYEERRAAYAALIDQASSLRQEALLLEFAGKDRPSDYLDPPDLETHFSELRRALNEVLLLGTKETRAAAERVGGRTEAFVWSWETDDYRNLDHALIEFRAAARADLGIEGGAEEVATSKPAPPLTRRGAAKA
ncbi:hypothetical protein [Intrasporangium flavum]|uniref:hypothetical protein n=1 Tax=Intrasporangium flavum TaxID=1428657 RepID=UPI001A95B574|nr:hypothetical protein [Intrasporangium flavum]